MILRLVAILFVGMVLVPREATAEFHNFYVCNYLEDTEMSVGLVMDRMQFFTHYWHASAWYRVEEDGCDRLWAAEEIGEVYLSIKVRPKGQEGFQLLPSGNTETFFCMRSDGKPTEVNNRTSLSSLRDCSSRYRLHLFNYHIEFKDSQLIRVEVKKNGVSLSRSRSVRN